jgi:small subunit ribosomal protein S4
VNGRIVNIPSFTVKVGDVVSIREKSKNLDVVQDTLKTARVKKYGWLELNTEKLEGKYVEVPNREQIPENIREQLIVELYSK